MQIFEIPASQSDPASARDVPNITLELLQGSVKGYIEPVRFHTGRLTMYVNEEGKLDGLAPNPRATEICRIQAAISPSDWIVGDVVFVETKADGEDDGLTQGNIDLIQTILDRYK